MARQTSNATHAAVLGERRASRHPGFPGVDVSDTRIVTGEKLAILRFEDLEGGRVPSVAAHQPEDSLSLVER
jgi:hypothetical protein